MALRSDEGAKVAKPLASHVPGNSSESPQAFRRGAGPPENERTSFLNAECADAPDVIHAVESLLKAHSDSREFLVSENSSHRLGRYLIGKELGRGAMGIVYSAIDPIIGRSVAVKVIRMESGTGTSTAGFLRERLLHEARLTGTLFHPGIVIIFDVGEQRDLAFIAMELVQGRSVQEILASKGCLTRSEGVHILRQAAAALDYAHDHGVVHCDIKPGNIMLTENDTVKIADFGIAKITTLQQQTISGMAFGTPTYMSPEQIEMRRVNGRSDQFSLGVVAFELLTGARPFQADSRCLRWFTRIVYDDCPSAQATNPSLHASVDQVLRRVLAKQPENRYHNCREFVAELEMALNTSDKIPLTAAPVESRAIGLPEAAVRATPLVLRRSGKWTLFVSGGLAAAAILAGSVSLYRSYPPRLPGQALVAPVGSLAPTPVVKLFAIDPDTIMEGSAATLRWDVTDVGEVEIEPTLGGLLPPVRPKSVLLRVQSSS